MHAIRILGRIRAIIGAVGGRQGSQIVVFAVRKCSGVRKEGVRTIFMLMSHLRHDELREGLRADHKTCFCM